MGMRTALGMLYGVLVKLIGNFELIHSFGLGNHSLAHLRRRRARTGCCSCRLKRFAGNQIRYHFDCNCSMSSLLLGFKISVIDCL